jgi:hypothetical protein
MSDWWNDSPEEPEIPLCPDCDIELEVDNNRDLVCSECGYRIKYVPDYSDAEIEQSQDLIKNVLGAEEIAKLEERVVKTRKYLLNSAGEPVLEPDLLTWARAFEELDRRVKAEQVGEFWVSTVFLGVDYNHDENDQPILWETMVFIKGKHDCFESIDMDRCSGGREQALAMHEAMVERIRTLAEQ